MDQLKTFLQQCVKYRFWIAAAISMILPMVGYFVGSGTYTEATTKREGEIKGADTDVAKYLGTLPNPEYPKLVNEKKEALTKDVDATQRKLYEKQEPLLKWPEVVQDQFRAWGRKWPENVDRGQVQAVINDYSVAYPEFVTRVYQTLKPWNPENGSGIVFAPDQDTLLKPAPFTLEAPPELGKVWAEQERLWVLTALLDVIAKVNNDAGAKDWDGAWIKQILTIDVGSPLAQDQKSMAKNVVLEPAPPLLAPGTPPPDAAAAASAGGPMPGSGASSREVYYLKSDAPVPYKVLPVQLTVLIDQARLSEYLVALENSPLAIQVMEPEISKPSVPVVKPVYGESTFGTGGAMNGLRGGGNGPGGIGRTGPSALAGRGAGPSPMGGPTGRENMGGPSAGSRTNSGAVKKGGTDLRGVNKADERKKLLAKAAADKAKAAQKKGIDQYFNIIEVTIYGQARFYNTPPPAPPVVPSTEAPAPAPAAEPTPAPAPANAEPAPTPANEMPAEKNEPTTPATKPDPASPATPPDAPASPEGSSKPDMPKSEPPKPEQGKPGA